MYPASTEKKGLNKKKFIESCLLHRMSNLALKLMAAQLILKVSLFCHQAEYLLHCVTLMFLYLVSHSPCNILKYASLVFVKSSIICITASPTLISKSRTP